MNESTDVIHAWEFLCVGTRGTWFWFKQHLVRVQVSTELSLHHMRSLMCCSVESQISVIVTVCWWVDWDWNWLSWQPVIAGTNLKIYFEFTLGCSYFGVSRFCRDCFYSQIANEEICSLHVKQFLSPYFILTQGYSNTCRFIYDQRPVHTVCIYCIIGLKKTQHFKDSH